jgi:hypothetical protein
MLHTSYIFPNPGLCFVLSENGCFVAQSALQPHIYRVTEKKFRLGKRGYLGNPGLWEILQIVEDLI